MGNSINCRNLAHSIIHWCGCLVATWTNIELYYGVQFELYVNCYPFFPCQLDVFCLASTSQTFLITWIRRYLDHVFLSPTHVCNLHIRSSLDIYFALDLTMGTIWSSQPFCSLFLVFSSYIFNDDSLLSPYKPIKFGANVWIQFESFSCHGLIESRHNK